MENSDPFEAPDASPSEIARFFGVTCPKPGGGNGIDGGTIVGVFTSIGICGGGAIVGVLASVGIGGGGAIVGVFEGVGQGVETLTKEASTLSTNGANAEGKSKSSSFDSEATAAVFGIDSEGLVLRPLSFPEHPAPAVKIIAVIKRIIVQFLNGYGA